MPWSYSHWTRCWVRRSGGGVGSRKRLAPRLAGRGTATPARPGGALRKLAHALADLRRVNKMHRLIAWSCQRLLLVDQPVHIHVARRNQSQICANSSRKIANPPPLAKWLRIICSCNFLASFATTWILKCGCEAISGVCNLRSWRGEQVAELANYVLTRVLSYWLMNCTFWKRLKPTATCQKLTVVKRDWSEAFIPIK